MTAVGNPDVNNVRPLPFIHAAVVGATVATTGLVSMLAQEAIASVTGTVVPFSTIAVTIGTSLFFGLRPLMNRIDVQPGAVYFGGLMAMIATHTVAASGFPVAGFASGAILGGWVAASQVE